MKILVCVKVIKGEINPFDESALECAFQMSDNVTVISMGPDSTKKALAPLTRLGAKVTLISDSIFAGSDTLATSGILSAAIKNMEYDLILCGRQSIDGDTAQVGPMLSELLGIPLITNALSVKADENRILAQTRFGSESALLPALITMERGYVLRFPSIFSKPGEITTITNNELKCDKEKCGLAGSPTRVIQTFENQRGKRRCEFITADKLKPLISTLMAKQPEKQEKSETGEKLDLVWAIGEEVLEKAKEIAHKAVLIQDSDIREIIQKIKDEKPDVVLWNADLWGRKYAPIAAASLKTGLCADCTQLEAEGNTLIMYRPAQGGNIYAKIKCLTLPQMATVRTKAESSDIIVAGGKGVSEKIDALTDFAKKLNAELAASRGLVDTGKMPYEYQVGLTGKTVSPKIYIAVGISGAVHHTCAIEGADTVIAVNPDKDARIFEYADYGILANFEDIKDL